MAMPWARAIGRVEVEAQHLVKRRMPAASELPRTNPPAADTGTPDPSLAGEGAVAEAAARPGIVLAKGASYGWRSSTSKRDVRSPSSKRHRTARGAMSELRIELDVLTPAEQRDLANALLRAAWSAVLEETRVLLLDLLVEVDDAVLGDAA